MGTDLGPAGGGRAGGEGEVTYRDVGNLVAGMFLGTGLTLLILMIMGLSLIHI